MKNEFGIKALAFFCLFAALGCGKLTEKLKNGSSDNTPPLSAKESGVFSLSDKQWTSYDLDRSDIRIELPGKPADKSPSPDQLNPGFSQVFSAIKLHSFDDLDFRSSYTQLEPTGKRKFTIEELAETSMAALKRQIPELKYELDVTSDEKARYDGQFTRGGKSYALKGCCIYKKTSPQRVWAVITIFPTDNADAVTASERIIGSASFKDFAGTCN